MLIFILALLVFGPKKLPEVSRQIGRGIREFRRASDEVRGEIEGALNLDDDTPEDTHTISTNGHAAESANAPAPESPEDPAPQDDGRADGPATTERTD
jgi:TatA/E family protein of Tat protein translocase